MAIAIIFSENYYTIHHLKTPHSPSVMMLYARPLKLKYYFKTYVWKQTASVHRNLQIFSNNTDQNVIHQIRRF